MSLAELEGCTCRTSCRIKRIRDALNVVHVALDMRAGYQNCIALLEDGMLALTELESEVLCKEEN